MLRSYRSPAEKLCQSTALYVFLVGAALWFVGSLGICVYSVA